METKLDITTQMQAMIKDVDMMSDEIANSVSAIMREGGEIIANEQRRLISGKSSKLAALIKVGKIYATKKGNATVSTGYDTEAIKEAPEGVILEFGRAGKKSTDKIGRKIGKTDAVNHIRKGFDNKKDEATQIAVNKLDEVLKKW